MANNGYFLALNGEHIPLKKMVISAKLDIKDQDASGKSSATTTSEQGIKAKQLRVSGLVPYTDKDTLTLIFRLAEAMERDGAQKVYRINCPSARMIGMLQGIFTGGVGAEPDSALLAWKVDFTLKERVSAAEKSAARHYGVAGGAAGGVAGGGGGDGGAAVGTDEKHGWFYNVSRKLDNFIGPSGNETRK